MPPPDVNTLVLYDLVDPPTLDPLLSWGMLDGQLIEMIFSKLIRFNHEAQIVPDLAQEWSLSEDGLIYTFRLRSDAKFTNGNPVVAEDVKYSLDRVLLSKKSLFEPIESVNILDDHTLQIRLTEPYPLLLNILAMPSGSIVPKDVVEEFLRLGKPFGEQPVGSGPWVLETWLHDQYLSFRRNEAYWSEKPVMERLVYRIINNPFTAIAEFEMGNVALLNPLPEAEVLRWKTHPDWKKHVILTQLLNIDMILFNCQRPPFDRFEVRRAISQAVNTPLLLEAVREGAGRVSTGPIPPGLKGHKPGENTHAYDLVFARKVLIEHGLEGREIVLLMPSLEGFVRTTAEVLQALLQEAGLRVRIIQTEWATYRALMVKGEFDLVYRTWMADYPDGDNFLFPLFHSSQIGKNNFSRFEDAEVDALIEATQRELDGERRVKLLEQADDLVYQKAPALFLWHRANYSVKQPWLKEFRFPLIFNGTRFLEEKIAAPREEEMGELSRIGIE